MTYKANDYLQKIISLVKLSGRERILKISIHNEELILDTQKEAIGNWSEDYESFVEQLIDKTQPCYLLFRLDLVNKCRVFEWVLIIWCPEQCPSWQKMLYYSVRIQLKYLFDENRIVNEYFATNSNELTLSAYQEWKERNTEKRNVKRSTVEIESHINAVEGLNMPGFRYPLSEAAVEAIKQLKEGMISYLQFKIDFTREEVTVIEIETHKEFDINRLAEKVPSNDTRYHLISQQTEEDARSPGLVFIYTMANNGYRDKEEMFVSCRNALINAIEDKSKFGFNIDVYLESNNPEELTKAFVSNISYLKRNTETTEIQNVSEVISANTR